MSLHDLQVEFLETLFTEENYASLLKHEDHLSIYQNNIQSALFNLMKEIYPLIRKLVGEDFFILTCKEYIKRYPSRQPDLHQYGEYFQDFIAEFPPLSTLAYLSEVAKFEWYAYQLFFAADAPIFNINILENMTSDHYDQLQFNLNPASQLIQFQYPILKIIDLCEKNNEETLDLSGDGINLLMLRCELQIRLIPLDLDDFTFLTAIHHNETLSQALEKTLEINIHFNLEEKLKNWIKDKVIVSLTSPEYY